MSLSAPVRPPTAAPAADDRPGEERPAWARPALVALLLGTAALYLWGLSANGYANEFYAAAAQAGSQSWKAWFFGSLDAGNAITVDKTPASLWVMGLSIRLFGLSSWALLVPQALMGVGTVALVVAAVRRTVRRPGPALLAGLVMALTPVAVVMFRFDNPDALLTLLLTAAAYAVVRALEGRRALRWLVLAGALVGFAFLAKMLQAFLVLPGFAVAYLLVAHGRIGRRLLHLLAAGAAMVVAGGWWVAIVQLWPASSRPYIGGSTNNSVLELALGYNGLSRLTGSENGPQSGTPGLWRLFGSELGGQIAWLLPAALIALVAGLVLTARAPRTDPVRAGLAVWGGWLVVTALTFSLMAGIFHAYYTVALAPAVAALVGIGVGLVWPRRDTLSGSVLLASATLLTTAVSFALLSSTPAFLPALRWVVVVGGLVATVGLTVAGAAGPAVQRATAALAIVVALAGPAAYSVESVTTAQNGSMPTAGPAVAGFGARGGGFAGGAPSAAGTTSTGDLEALLEENAADYTWVAATTGSQSAAGYQLATGDPVMAIGGFNGGDDSPTLAQFQRYVAEGRIHYYLAGGGMGGGGRDGGQGSAAQIAEWVAAHYTASTVGGVTVYDLTS
ncbi:ArnT family glycosyltransferase [Petropleomorpha daqingensis]|uniref:4-amino-4-deoxy-L-arabinose transferase-like glycosyltransferase n=1 Tax=Petropleomorpha daqingensis TaxID=2026353 RepID=A0A853CM70_9ACTN|nr:glycosyltransferase family 39 protein [Petropleomorpha daqingensis]NYJ08526.1 4-amino-4-deoxy-L-arabinose transferase-like glycosyltransferase [Petropleomorpha daqingensis]